MHILKNQLGSGEISRLLEFRTDTDKNFQGCLTLKNGQILPQSGVKRRQGSRFIIDLSDLTGTTGEVVDPPRWVDFTFNENQAYALCFYKHPGSGETRVAFFTDNGIIEDSLNPGNPYIYTITGVFDHTSFDYATSGDTIFIAQSGRQPLKFVRNDVDNWTMSTIAFLNQPADWSTPNGWPELVGFYEQRIVYASILTRPQTLWFSKAGDFTNFGVSSPVVDSDAITLTLDSGQQNRILWLSAAQRLLVGTVGNEWSISGVNGPITPTSLRAIKETNQGSEKLKPYQTGPVTLFLEKFGKTVNQLAYDFNVNSYNVVDLSILSPQLTRNNKITNWSFQKNPGNLLWAIRDDGVLLSLTYQREHGVLAWTRNDTDGKYIDVISIPGNVESDVWFIVLRNINGTERYYVEKLAPEMKSDDMTEAKFVDSYLEYSGVATDTITGLSHLEGKEVHVLGDLAVVTPTTVSSGQITLDTEVSDAVIGLSYNTDILPLMPDVVDDQGPTLGRTRKLTDLYLMFFETVLAEYASYCDGVLGEMREIPFLDPNSVSNEPIDPFTGIIKCDVDAFQDMETKVLIRQSKPLPMTLLSVVYKLTVADQ